MLSGLQHQYDVHEEDLQRARLIENQADYMGDKENIEYAKVNAANNRAYLQAQTKLTNEQAAQTAREGRIPPTIFSEFKAMGLEDPYGMNEGEGPTPDQWNTAQNRIYQRQLGRAAVGPNISQRGADNRQAKSFAHSDQAANIKREQMPLKMNFTQKRDFGKTIGKKASEVTSQDIINYNRSVADHYRQDFDSQYVDSDASPSTNPMPGPSKTPKSTPKKIYVEGKDF
jgi:hypothetical protein